MSIRLDRDRRLKWTHRAEARLGSLERPPRFSDLAHRNSHRAFYALCAFVWAALVDGDDIADPTELAEHLGTEEQQRAAFAALRLALIEGGVLEQKKTTEPASSTSGPSP